jgi:hypothetical protein
MIIELVLEQEDFKVLDPCLQIQEEFKQKGWKPVYVQEIKQCASRLNEILDKVNKILHYQNQSKIPTSASFIEFSCSKSNKIREMDRGFLELIVKNVPEFEKVISNLQACYAGIRLNFVVVPLGYRRPGKQPEENFKRPECLPFDKKTLPAY